jgi:hypothetical protein
MTTNCGFGKCRCDSFPANDEVMAAMRAQDPEWNAPGKERFEAVRLALRCAREMKPKGSDPVRDALVELVAALDNAFISSWQSTADWQTQLDAARAVLAP